MDLSLIDSTISQGATSFLIPSFLSEYQVSLACDVLKWGAIIVASFVIATLIPRLRLLVVRRDSPILQPLLRDFVGLDDFSDDDASSVGASSLSEDYDERSEGEEPQERDSPSSSYQWGPHDFMVSGSGLRRRRSFAENLSQLYSGRNVVKLWDNIGSRFRSISLADGSTVDIPVIRPMSPGIIVSAGLNDVRSIALNAWDARVGFRVPAILAEWSAEASFPVVGDVRNVRRPLAEDEMEDWSDADAVDGDGATRDLNN